MVPGERCFLHIFPLKTREVCEVLRASEKTAQDLLSRFQAEREEERANHREVAARLLVVIRCHCTSGVLVWMRFLVSFRGDG